MGVYLWTEYKRKPWGNTVAYRPLTSQTTVNDMSGNGNNLVATTENVTYEEIGWVDSVRIPTWYWYLRSNWAASYMPAWWDDRTISLWLYNITTQQQTVWYWFWYGSSAQDKTFSIRQSKTWSIYHYKLYLYTDEIDTWVEIAVWEWQNHIVTYSNWVEKYYINWQLVANWSYTLNTASSVFSIWTNYNLSTPDTNWKPNWCVSNFIVENVARTADKVLKYYNSLKSKYWLS